MAEPSCWAPGLVHVLEYAVGRGADRAALLSRAQVPPARLQDPDARVPLSATYAVVEAAAEALRDPYFGLNASEALDAGALEPGALDVVGLLTLASRTVGEALRRLARFHPLVSDGEVFDLEVVGGHAHFRFIPSGRSRAAHAHVVERCAADCLLLPQRLTGAPVDILSFELAHRARCEGREFQRRFGRVPRFDAGHNTWSIPAEVLERPLPKADPGLHSFFGRHLGERAREVPATGALRERVHRLLCEGMPEGEVSLEAVAQKLQLSARTLQRHLASEGTSVDALLEEARSTRACVLLDLGRPLVEVGFLLGYVEPAAFQRAFKRWTGMTPRAWRTREQRAAS